MAGYDHDHSHAHAGSERRLFWAMLLIGGFMFAEVVGGIVSGSLALLADAGHMLTDTAALALALAAFRIGRRPRDARRTYGYHRLQVLAAFVNGIVLIAVVLWIVVEAVRRFFAPVEVLGGLMLAVAVLGLLVNVAAFLILRGAERDNLNVRGAALHVLADLLSSIATITAALVILATGWTRIDPLLSLLVALLILRSAWFLVRRAGHILLEGAPDWLDVDELRAELTAAVPEVEGVHHVHAWMLTSERPLMTLHATVRKDADYPRVLLAITRFLQESYGVGHATVQIEPAGCVEDAVQPPAEPDAALAYTNRR